MSSKEKLELWVPVSPNTLSAGDIVAEACFDDDGCEGWHEKGVLDAWRDGTTAVAVLLDDAGRQAPVRWLDGVAVHVYAYRRRGARD